VTIEAHPEVEDGESKGQEDQLVRQINEKIAGAKFNKTFKYSLDQ
jgi:hypothetical protein